MLVRRRIRPAAPPSPVDTLLDQARTQPPKTATAVHMTGTWVTKNVEYQIDSCASRPTARPAKSPPRAPRSSCCGSAPTAVCARRRIPSTRRGYGRQDPGADEIRADAARQVREGPAGRSGVRPALSGFHPAAPAARRPVPDRRQGQEGRPEERARHRDADPQRRQGPRRRAGHRARGFRAVPDAVQPGAERGRARPVRVQPGLPSRPAAGDKVVDYGSLTGASPTGKPRHGRGRRRAFVAERLPEAVPGTSTKNPS
ncbi:hypothetical protein ACU686_07545 [Yinghuangia aomiensis]